MAVQTFCKQAKNFSTALLKGDPDENATITGAVKQVLEGILPHKD